MSQQESLINYLIGFINPKRAQLLQHIAAQRTQHLTFVLENFSHAHNISALVRTSECFGLQQLNIIEKHATYERNKKINKGADKWIHINRFDDQENGTLNCIQGLKSKGYKIVATSLHQSSVYLHELKLDNKIAIILGSEGYGVSQTAMDCADEYLKIDTAGFTESLNVSVAGGIIANSVIQGLKNQNINYLQSKTAYEQLLIEWLSFEIYGAEELIKRFLEEDAKH